MHLASAAATGQSVRAVKPVDGAQAIDGDEGTSAPEGGVRQGNEPEII